MKTQDETAKTLAQFNNRTFTKKQWDIILQGCGCPKSSNFWAALRQNNLVKYKKVYTLVDIDTNSYALILDRYSIKNKEYVKKSKNKATVLRKIQERRKTFKNITFYMVNGILTTEKPEREL